MNSYKLIATIAFVLLTAAFAVHRRRRPHVALALSAIALDLGMVLWLEFERSVIAKASGEVTYDGYEIAHIVSSSIAVLLYLPTLYLGFKLLKGDNSVRKAHKYVAEAAYLFRAVGFALMWAV